MRRTNDSNGQSRDHGGGGDGGGSIRGEGGASLRNLTMTHALSYLAVMKQIFQNQTEKYYMFQAILIDFKAHRIDTASFRERVKELIKGHSVLISGFNAFMPKGYEITPDEDGAPPKKVVDFYEARDFIRKMRERFQNDDHGYQSFKDIMNMFRSGRKDVTEVYAEVSSLLDNHPDLLEEFTRFVPNYFTPPSIQRAAYGQNLVQCFNEQNSATAIKQQLQLDKQPHQRDKLISSHDHNLSIHSSKLNDGKVMSKEHKKQVEQSGDRKINDRNDREPDLSNKRGMYDQAFGFCEKVKERLGSSDDHQAFLKCLHMFSSGILNRHDLNDLVVTSLGKYPDLMDEFDDVVDQCENIDGFLANAISKKSSGSDGQLFRSSKLEDKDRDQKREVHMPKEREENHEKYMGMSIHELDPSDCEHCNPSYRHLPRDHPIPIPSRRSKLDAEVLNDHWLSVTSGSEDYSFKHMLRNQYERSLFKCEDDQFELDLLIERVRSTAKRTEELYNSIIGNKINIEGPIHIEEYFSVLHLKCIERLYGDYGLEAMEALRKNPIVALPVMLSRLKQKRKEWKKCRSEFNKVWAEIYAENYYKSLDHRSFYFKQQDSKKLNPKALVAEIKEIKEKQQKQEWPQVTAADKLSPIPHIQFEFSDVGIHEDLYKLVCYACKVIIANKGLLNKMLRVWTTFLEPMLGVPSRSDRQPKSDKTNGRETEAKKFCQICFECGDKEAGSGDGRPCKDNALMERGPKNVDGNAKAFDFSKQFAHDAQNDHDSVAKSQIGDLSVVENCDGATPDLLANGVPIQSNDFAGHCQTGKEETELSSSLNGDSEEDNCVGNGDGNVQVTPSLERNARRKYRSRNGEEECPLEVGIHNDADVEDKDIENASEGGEDVSGGEFADHQCPQEEHEGQGDMEHDDIDDKAEVERMCNAQSDSDGSLIDRSFLSAKTLTKYVSPVLVEERRESRVIYGNDDFYVLFRLHHILYERILSAKTNSMNDEMKRRIAKDANSPDPYSRFMDALYNLLDGSVDHAKFEDECQEIIGNQSYMLFTLDKLIHKLVKQLQVVANVEINNILLQLLEYQNSQKPERQTHSAYLANARVILPEENIYRLECSSGPSKLFIWLMDSTNEMPTGFTLDPNFADYRYNDFLSVFPVKEEPHGFVLRRNMRKHGASDEFPDMEGVIMINNLEHVIACNSIKHRLPLQEKFDHNTPQTTEEVYA
ncbi:paired amphipathic helix protein Sin3-like 2 [Neltuma alba]|uniref:paired amphipathic helix protein Sin3-like 2 n=1 Tax=Neltuma alba TaxID=207710 RepID=UPI0010A55464|nr:paired amphipathic helix protein Sin3-like 2 [Prosopis alba]